MKKFIPIIREIINEDNRRREGVAQRRPLEIILYLPEGGQLQTPQWSLVKHLIETFPNICEGVRLEVSDLWTEDEIVSFNQDPEMDPGTGEQFVQIIRNAYYGRKPTKADVAKGLCLADPSIGTPRDSETDISLEDRVQNLLESGYIQEGPFPYRSPTRGSDAIFWIEDGDLSGKIRPPIDYYSEDPEFTGVEVCNRASNHIQEITGTLVAFECYNETATQVFLNED